jgi:hypothetical protein
MTYLDDTHSVATHVVPVVEDHCAVDEQWPSLSCRLRPIVRCDAWLP